MNCDEIGPLLQAYLDNRLINQQKIDFATHLAQCPNCQQEARSYRELSARLENLERPAPPEALVGEVMERVAATSMPQEEESVLKRHQQGVVATSFSTVLLVIFGFGLLYFGVGTLLSYLVNSSLLLYDMGDTLGPVLRASVAVIDTFRTPLLITLEVLIVLWVISFFKVMNWNKGRIKIATRPR